MSDYLYFSNDLKDKKEHILDYIVSCKNIQWKVTACKENMNL